MGNNNTTFPSPTYDGESDLVVRSIRDEKPLHYTLKIQSFSLLKDAIDRFESQIFHASGYKWKLALYPHGNVKTNGLDHISLYLVLVEDDISSISSTSKVNVVFTFLIHDILRDKYLAIQDGKVRRFHGVKTEWGFEKLIPLEYFNDASNGLLVGDCCAFGVDIFVKKCGGGEGEVFSLIKQPKDNKYTWTISNLSQELNKTFCESNPFTVEGYSWKIWLYPKGSTSTGFLSLHLISNISNEILQGSQVFVQYEMALWLGSATGSGASSKRKRKYSGWFGGEGTGFGNSDFMALSDLKVLMKTSRHNDTLMVEVKINVISTWKNFLDKGNGAARS